MLPLWGDKADCQWAAFHIPPLSGWGWADMVVRNRPRSSRAWPAIGARQPTHAALRSLLRRTSQQRRPE
jgi:hypothetical protein